jgi:glycosyltransferase involved in cell wall biosynthesis
VLIPLWNGVEFLPECLASVRAQSHPELEILIGVNGHPADSPVLARARELACERTRVLHLERRSAPRTRNRLAREARHEIVCPLDVDDLWRPDKLAAQLEAWRDGGHDVVGTQCEYFGALDGSPRLPLGRVPARAFFEANPMIHSSVMMRRGDAQYGDEYLHDYDLWLRLEASGRRFFNLAEAYVRHRVHPGSAFNARPDAEARKRALLVRHAGSECAVRLARLPWPLRKLARRRTLGP